MPDESKKPSHPFWRIALGTYFLQPRDVSISALLILLIATLADTLIPVLVMFAIDIIEEVSSGKSTVLTPATAFQKLLVIAVEMLVLVGFVSLATYGITRLQNRMVFRGAAKLRDDLFFRLQSQPVNFLTDRRMGEILSHLVGDVKALQDALLDLVFEIPFDAATVAGLMAVIFYLNVTVGAIFAGFMALVSVISLLLGRKGWGDQKSSMDEAAVLMSSMHESLGGIRAIHAFGASEGERERVNEASREQAEGAGRSRLKCARS